MSEMRIENLPSDLATQKSLVTLLSDVFWGKEDKNLVGMIPHLKVLNVIRSAVLRCHVG